MNENSDTTAEILLTVARHGDEVQLIWARPNRWEEEYYITFVDLQNKSRQIGDLLSELNAFTQVNENIDASWLPGGAYENLLLRLRAAGIDLYLALFNGLKEGGVESWVAARVTAMKDATLTIKCHKSVSVPWGFVCPLAYENQPQIDRDIADFSGFWLHTYHITMQVRGSTCERPEAENFKVLYAMHREEFLAIAPSLAKDRDRWEELLKLDVGQVSDWTRAGEKWKDIATGDNLLFVFCHKDEKGLYLGKENDPSRQISLERFENRFTRNEPGSTLLFLNGCASVAGGCGSFLSTVGRPGFCGLIGTEAEVSNDFALRYAARFISKFVQERLPIGKAFLAMRAEKDLYPRSLLYACYAFPGFGIRTPSQKSSAPCA